MHIERQNFVGNFELAGIEISTEIVSLDGLGWCAVTTAEVAASTATHEDTTEATHEDTTATSGTMVTTNEISGVVTETNLLVTLATITVPVLLVCITLIVVTLLIIAGCYKIKKSSASKSPGHKLRHLDASVTEHQQPHPSNLPSMDEPHIYEYPCHVFGAKETNLNPSITKEVFLQERNPAYGVGATLITQDAAINVSENVVGEEGSDLEDCAAYIPANKENAYS